MIGALSHTEEKALIELKDILLKKIPNNIKIIKLFGSKV